MSNRKNKEALNDPSKKGEVESVVSDSTSGKPAKMSAAKKAGPPKTTEKKPTKKSGDKKNREPEESTTSNAPLPTQQKPPEEFPVNDPQETIITPTENIVQDGPADKLENFILVINLKLEQISEQDCNVLMDALRPVMDSVKDTLKEPSTSSFTIEAQKQIQPPTIFELEDQDFRRKCENIEKQLTGVSNGISVIDAKKHISRTGIDSSFTPRTKEEGGGMHVRLYIGNHLDYTFDSTVIYGATEVTGRL